jgi:Mlc titration factor MtfA (ptsG expression regulator)
VAQQSFPEVWQQWLARFVPLYGAFDDDARARFERDVLFFLDEWRFEGVADTAVQDRHRLAVAAGAALILHGRPDWELPTKRTILLYPDRFDDDYLEGQGADYDGMVHAQGPIILTRQAVEQSWAYPHNGDNVVLHELAHLFDFTHAEAVGVPTLMDPASAEAWERLVRQEMRRAARGQSLLRPYAADSAEAWERLVRQEMRRAARGQSLLRPYAAENGAELFAVAVENFFERPDVLKRRHEALYNALANFFNLDVAGLQRKSP